jgi:hypothetical protein
VDAERLAAYLAGELDADESAALAAAIARDPRLRAELDAMQRADAALGSLAPTDLPAGFDSRLRAALDTELAAILRPQGAEATASEGSTSGATVGDGPTSHRWTDQLAARRARRARSWAPAFAGAAAAVAAIAVVGVGVGVLGGGGADMDDAAGDMEMTLEADDADGSEEAGMMAAPGPGEGPTVIAQERVLDDALADELLTSIELQAVTDLALGADEGGSLGAGWRQALADFHTAADEPAEDADVAEDAPQTESDEDLAATFDRTFAEDVAVRLFADAPPSDVDLAAADRCLAEVLAAGTEAIPVYLELATYEGEEAVVVGLVTFDPATEAYTRPEVWVLAREDCQVRRFSQG